VAIDDIAKKFEAKRPSSSSRLEFCKLRLTKTVKEKLGIKSLPKKYFKAK